MSNIKFRISLPLRRFHSVVLFCAMLLAISPGTARGDGLPQRIVSLSPSITEGLFQLRLQKKVVGVTTFCLYPAEAAQKPKIGTVIKPNIERIISVRPDIVLATETNPRPDIDKLSSLGIRVLILPPEKSFADICRNLSLLGKALGAEKTAESVIKKANERIMAIKVRLKKVRPVKVFWEVGASPLVTVGKGTFADELLSMAGGVNIAHNAPARYVRYSREEVLIQNPEAIILVTMGDVTAREIAFWQKYKELKAVKDRRIYVIEAHPVCSPTPLTFVQGLEKVASFLHPACVRPGAEVF
ncbi:MAG: ABC transporter substrate-binding protein [Deltaproteobacteria bacterium]|nr:ABC transporter substrate-binding protein [Deltaproteobacteria bacterium]